MHEAADADAHEDVREDLAEGRCGLAGGVERTFTGCASHVLFGVHRLPSHEVHDLIIHAKSLNQCAARDCDHQSEHCIKHGHARPERTRDQHQAAEVDHR